MFIKQILKCLLIANVVFLLAGCGNDSSKATLAVTVTPKVSSGTPIVTLDVISTVTPARAGVEVSYAAHQYDSSLAEISGSAKTGSSFTGSLGVTPVWQPTFTKQAGATVILVTATVNGMPSYTTQVDIAAF